MVRTRFAPSPTGYMHIGNLRTALYAYLFARKNGGVFLLRLEDTDTERFVEGAAEIIYRTLAQAGLKCDEGPGIGGDYGPYIQSERKPIYGKYAAELVKCGAAYPCFCTRERLAVLKESGATKYDKHCRHLPQEEVQARIARGDSYCIRQNIPDQGETTYFDHVFGEIRIDYKDLEDNVLLKSDGMPTYNLANVIDDHLMGITHVIRGSEYLSSTPKYNMLYDSLGWARPEYIHLQPIMRDETHKLSKRHGDASFEDFVKKGYLSEAIINYIALLGWSPKNNREKMSLAELEEAFSIDGISKSASIFDEAKMRWLNTQYFKEMSLDDFTALAAPYYDQAAAGYDHNTLSALLKDRIEVLSDIESKLEFLNSFGNYDTALYLNAKQKTDIDTARTLLPSILQAVESAESFDSAYLFEMLSNTATSLGVKKPALFWVMRIAITGAAVTPGGATEMAQLLGKERTVQRLKYSIDYLG